MNKLIKKLLKVINNRQMNINKPRITISSGLTSSVNPGEVIELQKRLKGGMNML